MADDKKKPKPKPAGEAKKPAAGGKAPVLGFGGLRRGLLLFAILAAVPLGLGLWCIIAGGQAAAPRAWLTLGLVLAGSGLAALALWLAFPLAQFLRRWAQWRLESHLVLWCLPVLLSTPFWIAFYLVTLVGLAGGGFLAWTGLEHLGLLALLGR